MKQATPHPCFPRSALLALGGAVLLLACHGGRSGAPSGPTDAQLVAQAKGDLVLTFALGDSPSGVTRNLGLPATGLHDVAVTWASSSPEGISPVGVVVRPTGSSLVVTLTATLRKGAATDIKPFSLILLSGNASIATPDGVQASGALQKAGTSENAPTVGEALPGTTATSATGAVENTHGFQPPAKK